MKNRLIIPLIGALAAGLTVFIYLRIFGDHTMATRAGLYLTAALGAAAGLMIGVRYARKP